MAIDLGNRRRQTRQTGSTEIKEPAFATSLNKPTLVLNRSWQPVNIASVARALVLVWNETARIVDTLDYQVYDWQDWMQMRPDGDEPFIQSVSLRLRIPEVIVLNSFDKLPNASVSFSRRNLFKRDRFTCQYCGCQPRPDELTIDHVVPRSQGGQTTWENCVLACFRCNHKKADKLPDKSNMKLRKLPAKPVWHPAYTRYPLKMESWAKFVSQAYWDSELQS